MSHPEFELLHRQGIEALNLTVESYRHRTTGARHLHLSADDPHNAFLVAFLTVPQDSTGVAHILEHTALCGSRRYPVRDPFFMMLRRSLSTFMNAFTASDWTAYPFASQSRKDFDNLLQVYLDAAFFPLLSELDFSQEGVRVEFERPDDPASNLVFKGIVFNEMKGAMSSPARVLWDRMAQEIFPTTTYHHNSGGDPERIPDLTWAALKGFHAKHYHPSNATFMTYGNIPAASHQAVFQDRALAGVAPMAVDFMVPDERRLDKPVAVTGHYALDGEAETAAKTHITLGWLLGPSIDQETLLRAHLINGVLLDNSSSPLLHALETSELGTAPSPLCGLDDSGREMLFACGLEGSEPERADAVERLVLDVLEKVAREGVELSRVEAVLHQLELSRREVGGDSMPYGLKLMLTALPSALHGGDPVSALALDEILEKLREEIRQPDFVQNLVRDWLLENPHRVRMVMAPDTTLNATKAREEAERLAAMKAAMPPERFPEVVSRAAELKKRQEEPDDPEILPRLGLADIPPDLVIPVGRERTVDGVRSTWFDRPTNRLYYQQMVLDLPDLEPALLELLPLYASFISEVGSGGRDYLETQAFQSSVSGGVGARGTVRGSVTELDRFQAYFTVSGKALSRNHDALTQLLRETLEAPRFDELPRLRELVAQMRASAEMRVTDHGHSLALSAASAGLSPTAAINNQWGGMVAIKRLKALDNTLNDPQSLAGFADRLAQLREILKGADRRLLIIGEEKDFDAYEQSLNAHWRMPSASGAPSLRPQPTTGGGKVGWSTVTTVNFCAKAYATVPFVHDDAPALAVLGQYLKNGFLHRAIRERGGAYGGGAGYDSDSGVFRFYSYRDPRLRETLEDFDRSLAWLAESRHEPRALEEAILGVIGSIDRPGSPAGEARRAFHDALNGRTPERRRRFRSRVLTVTMADLVRVARTWLDDDRAGLAVVSHNKALDEQVDGEWQRLVL